MSKRFLQFAQKYRLDYIALWLLALGYYGFIQWNDLIGDPDGFYHAKIAAFLAQGKLLTSLPWMQFSSLKDNFTDHHFLYHLILVPFTYLKNPLFGVKVASVFFAGGVTIIFYWLVKNLRLAYPWLLGALWLTMMGLTYRLSLIKVTALSLILICLLIYSLEHKKYWQLFVIGWLFVWTYAGWPLALIITLTYWLAQIVYRKFFAPQAAIIFNWRHLASLLAGLVGGLVINPYWPQNLYFYYQQIIQIGVINYGGQFAVGREWYGATLSSIVGGAPHIFILACLLFIIMFFNYQIVSRRTLGGFFLAFGFFILSLKSARYGEYYLPFALLFIGSAITDLKKYNWEEKIIALWKELPFLLKSFLLLALLFLISALAYQSLNVRLTKTYSVQRFTGAGDWLRAHTPDRAIIFHDNWSDWPLLFYHNDRNYYMIGLDPTFMHNYDQPLHELYLAITNGEVTDHLAEQIKNKFQTEFILVRIDANQDFITGLENDSKIKQVYQDEEVKIYQITLP